MTSKALIKTTFDINGFSVYLVLRYLRQTPDVMYLRLLTSPSKPGRPQRMAPNSHEHHVVEAGGIEPPSELPFAFKFREA